LARDVGNLLHQEVTEVTATFVEGTPTHRVVVGTEAVFARLRRAGVVIFVDVDQYLLAPRERARRDAVYAVAKAGRLVGSRSEARGTVVLQTRRARDAVISTLVVGNVEEIQVADVDDARLLESPPFGARAVISGDAAPAFVAALNPQKVRVSDIHDGFVVTATDVDNLTQALGEVARPMGRLRLAVE
jgi:primosomal protein N'